ncbi:MAG TPA: hypothetical protein VFA45_18000, partial [Actinomycetes bacterium]|nr:hypothetical protein [Actinomycetes bacterium]
LAKYGRISQQGEIREQYPERSNPGEGLRGASAAACRHTAEPDFDEPKARRRLVTWGCRK